MILTTKNISARIVSIDTFSSPTRLIWCYLLELRWEESSEFGTVGDGSITCIGYDLIRSDTENFRKYLSEESTTCRVSDRKCREKTERPNDSRNKNFSDFHRRQKK